MRKGVAVSYAMTLTEVQETPIISIREHRRTEDLPAFVGSSLAALFAGLGTAGFEPAGPPFVIYHSFGPMELDAEVGVPTAAPIPVTEPVKARVLPSATVVRTLHVGPYESLSGAYAALSDWVELHGMRVAGPALERYLNDPGTVASPADYQTEVELPVERIPAMATS